MKRYPEQRVLGVLACVSLMLLPSPAAAQQPAQDNVARIIVEMFRMHKGKTICLAQATSLEDIRAQVAEALKSPGAAGVSLNQMVARALWALYPCPFSPERPEARRASAADIQGAWVFPATSQKLRFGPQSGQRPPTAPLAVACDAVGYYSDGETRHAIKGGESCPFEKAADLDALRTARPGVASWTLIREGRIRITRTDVQSHIEEWDVFVVTAPFSAQGVRFEPGDLMEYERRGNGNELEAATQFRHLRRLP